MQDTVSVDLEMFYIFCIGWSAQFFESHLLLDCIFTKTNKKQQHFFRLFLNTGRQTNLPPLHHFHWLDFCWKLCPFWVDHTFMALHRQWPPPHTHTHTSVPLSTLHTCVYGLEIILCPLMCSNLSELKQSPTDWCMKF